MKMYKMTMTNSELIEKLAEYPEDAEVVVVVHGEPVHEQKTSGPAILLLAV